MNRRNFILGTAAAAAYTLLIAGPGFEGAQQVPELVGLIHIAPTLLDAAGVPVPDSMKGKSLLPLLREQLKKLVVASGDPEPKIALAKLYP